MAVRFRKYFPQCKGKRTEGDKHGRVIIKGVECEGKRSRVCPEGVPSQCGTWAIDFRHPDGRWVSKVYPEIKTKTEAEHFLSIIKTDILRGKFNLPCKKTIPTLKEYSKTYMESNGGAKENTLAMKKRAIRALVAVLGDYPLNKITPFIIEKYRIERKEKNKVKDSSINLDVSILSNVFVTAIKAGIIERNPCKDVKPFKITQTRDRILSQPEIALLLDRLQGKDRLMVAMGLFAGMRLGEVLSLQWQDIDFVKGLITFTQNKTGKAVIIPLSSYLAEKLQGYRDKTGGMIFGNEKRNVLLVREFSTYFSNLFKSLGIQNFTFHNLRHTFASLQADLGTGAIITKEMLGHSTLDMTVRYSHGGLDSKKMAIQKLTDHVLTMSKKVNLAIA